jgi:hypothetical protein
MGLSSIFPFQIVHSELKTSIDIPQGRHANDLKLCGKMLNVTSHQENANQYHNEISPQPAIMVAIKKKERYQVLVRIWRNENSHMLFFWEC